MAASAWSRCWQGSRRRPPLRHVRTHMRMCECQGVMFTFLFGRETTSSSRPWTGEDAARRSGQGRPGGPPRQRFGLDVIEHGITLGRSGDGARQYIEVEPYRCYGASAAGTHIRSPFVDGVPGSLMLEATGSVGGAILNRGMFQPAGTCGPPPPKPAQPAQVSSREFLTHDGTAQRLRG